MANTKIQIKRTTVSGRTPNTTNAANTQYIAAGELALNLTDGILYSSNGTGLITIGATQSSISACTVSATSVSATTVSATNVTITDGISVGNSTVNSSINSTALFSGNSSVNTVVNTVFISVSNAITNSSLSPQIVFVGNSSANAQLNLTGGTRSINVTAYSLTANGVATIQTQVNHNIILTPGYTATLSGVKSMFDGRVLKVTSIPTSNTFTFSFSATDLGSLSVSAVQRANGVHTYTTPSPHGLTAGQVVTVTGIPLDTNRFNLTGTIASAPTTNTFTILVSSLVNKTANLTTWAVYPITSSTYRFSNGSIETQVIIRTNPDHGYYNSFENVIFQNITNPVNGFLPFSTVGNNAYNVTSTKNVYSANSLTDGTKRIYNYTSNQVMLTSPPTITPMHGPSDGVWNGSQGTFNAGAKMVLSYDVPLTTLTSPGKITIGSIANTATNPATANVILDNPINLTVANSTSSVKVTPTSIFVGSGTTNVIIDATGSRFNKAGSILQTFVDGTGFTVSSLQSTDGAVDPDANSYFANASIVMLGNTTVSTLLTPNSIQSNTFYAIDSASNVTINSSSISMGSGFYINNESAYFPGIVSIGSTVELAGGIGANGDVGSDGNILTSNGTGVYWASAISANVNASTINATANVITPTLYGNVVGTTLNASSNVITTNVYATTVSANLVGATANLSTSVNSALLTVGTSFIANTTGAYHSGTINAASHTVGTTFTANATLVNAAALNIVNQTNTATLYVTTSANVGATIYVGGGVSTTNGATITNTNIALGNTFVNTQIIPSQILISSTATGNDSARAVLSSSDQVGGTLTLQHGNSTSNSSIVIGTQAGNSAVIELGGTTSAFIDFKVPFADDYDTRLLSNVSGFHIIAGSSTSANVLNIINANVNIGSGKLFIDNVNSRVGINTATPAQALEVVTGTTGISSFTDAAGNGRLWLAGNSSGSYVFNRDNSPLLLATANTERMRVDAGGNVAIGTTGTSGATLTVAGNVSITATVNAASHTVGTTFTANATLVNAAAINVTGQINTATFYAATSANVGTAVVANATGVYTTGAINAASHTIGTGFVANTTVLNSNTDLNVTVNNKKLAFATVNASSNVYFIQQNDDNFVFYSTNTAYGSRAVWSIYANSITSNLNFSVRTAHTGGLTIPSGVTLLDSTGSQGTSGQVLTSNGSSNVYWSTVSGGGSGVNSSAQYSWSNTQTFQANVSITANALGLSTNSSAIYLNGTSDANWKIGRNTGALTKWIYTNNTIDIVTANSTNEGFVVGLVSNATYFETGYKGTFIASNVTVGNSSSNLSINSTAISSNSIVVGSTNTAIFYNINGQVNASAGAFLSNAYAALGGYGGNYLAFGQQTNFAQWIQSGFSSAATPVYYNIILNPLGGNVGISNTAPTDRLSVNGTSYLQGNVRFTQGIIDATGTQGTSGQVLASNGSSIYWTTVGSPRVVSYANGTSITANVDSTDMATQINTAVAGTLTIGAPTGTPVDGQRLMFRIRCVNAQTLSWNAIFSGSTDLALPTTTSSGSKYDYVGFMYNSTQTKWNIVAKNFGF